MSFQRGFSSLGCPDFSLDEAIALARKHRLDCIELRALGGRIDLAGYFLEKFGSPADLAACLRRSDLRVVALDTSFKLIGSKPAERAELLQLVPWAEAAEISRLRVFDGGKTADEAEVAAAAETLEWWRNVRRDHCWRVDLMVETHDSLLSAASIGRLLEAAPGAGMLWDSHHTWRKGGEDPRVTWRAIRDHVVHVHVKDSVGVPGARHPFTYMLPGSGEFPMAALRAILAAEYTGVVSLEWEKLWHPDLPSLDAALDAAAQSRWW